MILFRRETVDNMAENMAECRGRVWEKDAILA